MKNLLIILKFARPFRNYLIVIGFFIIIVALNAQINPWLGKFAVDFVQKAVEGDISQDQAVDKITPILVLVIIAQVLNWFANRISWRFSMVLAEKLRGHLRVIALEHLLKQDISYFDKQSSGNVMSKVDRGINRMVDQIGEVATFFLPNVLAAIIAIALISQVKWEFALLMVVAFIPFIVINVLAIRRHEPMQKKINQLYDDEFGHFWEVISSIRLVKSFDRARYELKKMMSFNRKISRLTVKIEHLWDLASVKDLFLTCWVFGLNAYLIMQAVEGKVTLGTYFLLTQYTITLREPLWNLTWMYFEFKKMSIGARGFVKILNKTPKVIDNTSSDSTNLLWKPKGSIEFDGVRFEYKKGALVINDMNFKIEPGETVALVGRSGSGKSTIINLINRFYDVTGGSVMVDGIDVKNLLQSMLRKNIGMVLQDSYLYDDTIAENLRYGKIDATEGEMKKACELANAWEFIGVLPHKLNTWIGERGIKLSGGQKQRLSIARTILKNPRILILDEATSSLDSESEIKVQKAIWNLISDRTCIIIAHRLSTIRRADRIFVIDKGGIIESGTHEELLKVGGIYEKLYKYQSSREADDMLDEYELD
ncbi:MAG: hypothetical protein US52_C0034G0002 [candidate division WS6 bacterium GW2011_GWA2_37_6]|uniref:ABC transporter related protein n=1 Tax=candidate division WS6 bacterium GW2011_GWA2_37_6 TaxID=1619087 RepID=A0A0G0K3F1_9BACT|nr:MAG: hypothetical protein US52_C0034G0002 [candidate division WS6 bacterium GW2011_GWA2_37_6]